MGTRHLTIVVKNKEYKVAQYGQWDGYPSGQGKTVYEFLSTEDLIKFSSEIDKITFIPKDTKETFDARENPELGRDIGSSVLYMIQAGEVSRLFNMIEFAADSLYCEFAYLIDLDKWTLEVYKGFNKQPLNENDRFFSMSTNSDTYFPIKMVAIYNITDLLNISMNTFIAELMRACGYDDDE